MHAQKSFLTKALISFFFLATCCLAQPAKAMELYEEVHEQSKLSNKHPSPTDEAKKEIGVIGTGVGGITTAIALLEKFGDKVNVQIFEQRPSFDLSQGIELIVSSGFQIVMQALGHDMTADLQKYGYKLCDVSVMDCMGNVLPEIEEIVRSSGRIYTSSTALDREDNTIEIYPYNINRGVFMKLLQDQLLIATKGKNIIHWGYELDNITSENTKTLHFKNRVSFGGFDLVVGADGVHSKVRELLFDDHKATHVGANVLYGIMPGEIEIFNKDKFNIMCSKEFTTVSCCYKNINEEITTWWGIAYADRKNSNTQSECRAFWESQNDVKAIAHALVNEEEENTYPKQYIGRTTEFKYAGFFLERDPLTLLNWGVGNEECGYAALIGDAAHAMQPWAGAGASLAAEDGYLLAKYMAQFGFDSLPFVFERYKQDRKKRILYFRQLTRNNTPRGIMPTELSRSLEEVISEYGDQRLLTMCPAWEEMLDKRHREIKKKGSQKIL